MTYNHVLLANLPYPANFGKGVGTLHVTGSGGNYNVASAAFAATPTGYLSVSGFTPSTDTEVYALAVTDGVPANLAADLADAAAEINAAAYAGYSVTAATADPTGRLGTTYDFFVTITNPTLGTGSPHFGFDFTQFNGTADPLNVTAAAATGVAVVIAAGTTRHLASATSAGIRVSTLPGVTIQAGATGIVDGGTSHANRQLLVVTGAGLSIAGSAGNWTAALDLGNNDLDLPVASLATVTSQVALGYAGGHWNGPGGIVSSAAAADARHLTALGVIQNNQGGSPIYTSANPFDGTTPGAGDVLVKYTYYGDANLDGVVNGADYIRVDAGYAAAGTATPLTGWYNGDFNYDGRVDGSDYTLIDNAFDSQPANLSTSAVAVPTAEPAAVPEPALAVASAISAGVSLLARRRRVARG